MRMKRQERKKVLARGRGVHNCCPSSLGTRWRHNGRKFIPVYVTETCGTQTRRIFADPPIQRTFSESRHAAPSTEKQAKPS